MKNAEFVNLLYKNATATERTCSFCDRVVKQKKQAGYKNLITHLQGFHNGYETIAEDMVSWGGPKSKFIDTKWIPATSVAVERFFSTVKSTVGYLRKSMSQENLEVIIFLTLNWDLVTLADVSKAIQESRSNTDAEQE
ncbi:hypothetical protein PC129_g20646 [Phytophthora cactorum]|uniref:BED-type domain-containing protein n=1 Tax=Phytophthora cactorum TaxID=29920 RepID=A0A8T0YKY0_9STRA|nr:hypothetical protein Pcac1_g4182 [Phytophthora cactorum]KAG2798031.1 hypothetical protein PC112_g21530 [Phytophthora cactorum]KAG2810499.1 hypothetical protein PC111_g15634 [Phytophthora cactorum]KAG2850410.1 hypothetical protein PC113_g16806 [Phytophthora cactorum]KAG2888970.1 hypothetical protein PC114_g18166 [Phytophthora cactorum]